MPKHKNKKQSEKKIILLTSLLLLILGSSLVAFTYSPWVNLPQCEGTQTTNCIVGANIGAGLIFLPGAFLILIGLALLILPLLIRPIGALLKRIDSLDRKPKRILIIFVIILAALLIGLWTTLNQRIDSGLDIDSVELEDDYQNTQLIEETPPQNDLKQSAQ